MLQGTDAAGFEGDFVVLQVQRDTVAIATYLDRITASRARAAVLLVFVALCAFSPGFTAIRRSTGTRCAMPRQASR